MWSILTHLMNFIIITTSALLIFIILIQRGKGGGLVGAFGGAGGSSPFGSRTADQFVKVTMWFASIWILIIMIHVKIVQVDIKHNYNENITNVHD